MLNNDQDSFDKKMKTAFAVPPADEVYLGKLEKRLLSALGSSEAPAMHSRPKLALGWRLGLAFASLLLLFVLLAGPARVWANLRTWFLPGFGTANDPASILLVNEPVEVEKEGFILRLNEGFLAPERLILKVQLINPADMPAQMQLESPAPYLLNPDGARQELYHALFGQGSVYEGMEATLEFEPVESNRDQPLTLVIPKWMASDAPNVPSEMRLSFSFNRPADTLAIAPLEKSLPQPKSIDGVEMSIKAIYAMDDQSYLLVQFTTPHPEVEVTPLTITMMSLLDANGQGYPLFPEQCPQCAKGEYLIGLNGVPTNGTPLTLSVPYLHLAYMPQRSPWDETFKPSFQLDLDPSYAAGHVWPLELEENLGPYSVQVLEVKLHRKAGNSFVIDVLAQSKAPFSSLSFCAWEENVRGSCESLGSRSLMEPLNPEEPLVSRISMLRPFEGSLDVYFTGATGEYHPEWRFEIPFNRP